MYKKKIRLTENDLRNIVSQVIMEGIESGDINEGLWNRIKAGFRGAFGNDAQRIGNAASSAGQAVGDAASGAWNGVRGAASRAGKAVGKAASDAWNGVRGAASRAGQAVGNAASDAWNGARGMASRAGQAVGNAANSMAQGISGRYNAWQTASNQQRQIDDANAIVKQIETFLNSSGLGSAPKVRASAKQLIDVLKSYAYGTQGRQTQSRYGHKR